MTRTSVCSTRGPWRAKRPRLAAAAGIALAASFCAVPASAESCEPTVTEADGDLPQPWRRALELLVQGTGRPGLPWACHGGTARLAAGADGSSRRLIVTDMAGREVAQQVETPGDVVPLGKALLSRPLGGDVLPGDEDQEIARAPAAAHTDATSNAQMPGAATEAPKSAIQLLPALSARRAADRAEPAPTTATARGPRYGASLGPRLALPNEDLSIAARVHVLGALGRVTIGGWGRVDGPSWSLDDRAAQTSTFAAGPAVGYAVPVGRPELRLSLEPSLAVVVDRSGDADAEVDARLGASAELVVPVGASVRLTMGADGEMAPLHLDDHRGDRGQGRGGDDGSTGADGRERHASVAMPAAVLGVRFGLEVRP